MISSATKNSHDDKKNNIVSEKKKNNVNEIIMNKNDFSNLIKEFSVQRSEDDVIKMKSNNNFENISPLKVIEKSNKESKKEKKITWSQLASLGKNLSEEKTRYSLSVAQRNPSVSNVNKSNEVKVNENETSIKSKPIEVNNMIKPKKVPLQPLRNPNKKKITDPIVINIGNILEIQQKKKQTQPSKGIKSKFRKKQEKEFLSGNALDSSNPKRYRGKHREVKKKKISKLKLVIIKERIFKKKELGVAECINLIDNADFKVEIKNYLNDLEKRKLEKLKKSESPSQKNLNTEEKSLKKDKTEVEINVIKTESAINKNATIESALMAPKTKLKFSSRTREYCENVVTPSLNTAVFQLIERLVQLQDRAFASDPITARARKRHVSGIKEVKKSLVIKKAKMIVIAPNLEKLLMEGSLFDQINDLKMLAKSQNVPCVFALNRNKLGRCTKKNVPVSAFAVLNYDGVEVQYQEVLQHLLEAKKQFSELILKSEIKTERENANQEANFRVLNSFIEAFKEKLNVEAEENKSLKDD